MTQRRGRPRHPDILTPAEWRVLEQVRAGRANPEIAEELGLSLNTVKYHLSNILAKLDLPDREALRRWDGRPRRRWGWLVLGGWSATRAAGAVSLGIVIAGVVIGVTALAQGEQVGPPSPSATTIPRTYAAATEPTDSDGTLPSVPDLASAPSSFPSPLLRVCAVEEVDPEPLTIGRRLPDNPDQTAPPPTIVGGYYRVTDDGCVRHRPAVDMAAGTRLGNVPSDRVRFLLVECRVWPQQIEPPIEEWAVGLEPLYSGSDPTYDILYRIVEAPSDGIVFANCGVALRN
jgi:DNA-binding CsgD family transcriptional regulator